MAPYELTRQAEEEELQDDPQDDRSSTVLPPDPHATAAHCNRPALRASNGWLLVARGRDDEGAEESKARERGPGTGDARKDSRRRWLQGAGRVFSPTATA